MPKHTDTLLFGSLAFSFLLFSPTITIIIPSTSDSYITQSGIIYFWLMMLSLWKLLLLLMLLLVVLLSRLIGFYTHNVYRLLLVLDDCCCHFKSQIGPSHRHLIIIVVIIISATIKWPMWYEAGYGWVDRDSDVAGKSAHFCSNAKN